LKSYERIFTIPLPELDGDLASGVAVDLESGDKRKVVSKFKVSDDGGLSGAVHTSQDNIIAIQVISRE
jgi:hypothetical protein